MIKYLVNAHFKLDAETKRKRRKKKKDTALRPTGTMLFNFNTSWKKNKRQSRSRRVDPGTNTFKSTAGFLTCLH